jgi:hypothetical protein
MSDYNLFDHQKDLLRQMVRAFQKGCRADFSIFQNSMFVGVAFDGPNLHEQVACDVGDLVALNREGLIELHSRDGGSIMPRAMDAVRNDFVRQSEHVPAAGVHIHGGNVSFQIGDGNTANVQQNLNPSLTEVLALIQECHSLTASLDESSRSRTTEALDDLKSEITSPSLKKSRMLSFLASATKYATAGTALLAALSKLGHLVHHFMP